VFVVLFNVGRMVRVDYTGENGFQDRPALSRLDTYRHVLEHRHYAQGEIHLILDDFHTYGLFPLKIRGLTIPESADSVERAMVGFSILPAMRRRRGAQTAVSRLKRLCVQCCASAGRFVPIKSVRLSC